MNWGGPRRRGGRGGEGGGGGGERGGKEGGGGGGGSFITTSAYSMAECSINFLCRDVISSLLVMTTTINSPIRV